MNPTWWWVSSNRFHPGASTDFLAQVCDDIYTYICIWTLQAVQWMAMKDDFLEDANLSIKEGSLFCFVLQLWDPLNLDASDRVLGVFGKLSTRRGAWVWFHVVWTCCAKVLEYWMIFSLKIKLDRSWKFRCFWKDLNEQDLMEFIW